MRLIPVLLALVCALPSVSFAQPVGEESEGRWIPALGFGVGFLSQDGESSSSSSLVLGPAEDPDPGLIRPPDSGSGSLLGATFHGSFELSTPALDLPWAPRAFGHVGISGVLSSSKRINQEGSPGQLTDPAAFAPGATIDSEDDILGQGSGTEVEVEPVVLRMGLGVSLAIPLLERELRIKPSFEYIREEITVHGIVSRAIAQQRIVRSIDDMRLISLKAQKTQVYHGIGPGIEFEADAARAGDFVWSVFMGGQAWYTLGDREVDLFASDAPPGPNYGENASFRYEKEEWTFHAGIGIRVRWLPE